MLKASEIKRGDVVVLDQAPHVVKHLETKSPSSRGAVTLYKLRFKNLLNGQKKEVSAKGEDPFETIDDAGDLKYAETATVRVDTRWGLRCLPPFESGLKRSHLPKRNVHGRLKELKRKT